jgi:2-polyprenyl-3-methyl-5-hydroxy-6-metoxy-1,4-benzoquinol methylase
MASTPVNPPRAHAPDVDIEALNDRFAREHPIDDYYTRAALPIRLIERHRLAIIRRMVGPSAGLEVCEVGAGGGHVLRLFPDARLTAIDVSQVFLDTARKNLAGYDARFVKGEVDKLDLPAESYDRIICTEVLEHTVDPEAVLAAMSRLLRRDGAIVVTVPNDPLILRMKTVLRRTPLGLLLRNRIDWGGNVYHIHRWRPAEFERVLARHFRITTRQLAPLGALPIHACFRCVRR